MHHTQCQTSVGNMAYRHVVRNPTLQARIFLPNWFVKIVRPAHELPENVVQMHIPLDMGKLDLRNYLEKIYDVRVERVNTSIQRGKIQTVLRAGRAVKKKQPDFKVAYVFLAEGTFKFPDLYTKQLTEVEESAEEIGLTEEEKEKLKEDTKSQAKLKELAKSWFEPPPT